MIQRREESNRVAVAPVSDDVTLDRLCRRAAESSASAIMITHATQRDHPIVFVNPAFTEISGYTAQEAIGRSGRFLVGAELDQPGLDTIRNALRRGQPGIANLRCYKRDGSLFWNEVRIAPAHDEQGQLTHFVSIMSDITERVTQAEALEHMSTHDRLTGLVNRALLDDRIDREIASASRRNANLAVMVIDIDRFMAVNDALGNAAGDVVLRAIGERLSGAVRGEDTLARLGDDEFAVLTGNLRQPDDAMRATAQVLECLGQGFSLEDKELFLTASVGVAIYPKDGRDGDTLLRNARLAMQRIKHSGGNGFRCFSDDMDSRSHHLLTIQTDLRHALLRNEFVLHYQPRIDLLSGKATGAEALVRWQHPTRGLLQPADFIPAAENLRMMDEIGGWVLRRACRQAAKWQRSGDRGWRISVNISAQQLRDGDLARRIGSALNESDLDPSCLEIELTESAVMHDIEQAAAILSEIRALGVSLALDDFGTGYASLSYLHRLPFDYLKIDRSFVMKLDHDPSRASLTLAILAMAHSLGMRTIAEGVETEGELSFLRTHLCDEAQGFLFARPLPADDFVEVARRIEDEQTFGTQPLEGDSTLKPSP